MRATIKDRRTATAALRFAYADEIYVDMMYLSLSYWGELNNDEQVLAHTGGVSLYSGQGGIMTRTAVR